MDTEESGKIEREILDDLMPVLHETFGNCHLHTYGSTQTGLALKGSDLDINVDFGDTKHAGCSEYELNRKVRLCTEALRKDKHFSNIEARLNCKVPIGIMTHVPTKTSCDVSFGNSMAVEMAKLLKYYFHLNSRFLGVMVIIKLWAKKRYICNGRDYLSTFAWNLLFISYLQTLRRPNGTTLVPTVMIMQPESVGKRTEVQGHRVDFLPPAPDQPEDELEDSEFSTMDLLTGFFAYYRKFPFRDSIVCPYLGVPVSRTSYSCAGNFSPREIRHMANLRLQANQTTGTRFKKIIQDPFNHSKFLACRTYNLPVVINRIAETAKMCELHMKMDPPDTSTLLYKLLS